MGTKFPIDKNLKPKIHMETATAETGNEMHNDNGIVPGLLIAFLALLVAFLLIIIQQAIKHPEGLLTPRRPFTASMEQLHPIDKIFGVDKFFLLRDGLREPTVTFSWKSADAYITTTLPAGRVRLQFDEKSLPPQVAFTLNSPDIDEIRARQFKADQQEFLGQYGSCTVTCRREDWPIAIEKKEK